MTTLIIPDIHLKHATAERIISAEKADRIVFLGDYFHAFYDTVDANKSTAEWLKWSLRQPNRIHLWGNHDTTNRSSLCRCSGHTDEKCRVINSVLSADDWAQLKWFYILDSWLLTHAGLDAGFLPAKVKTLKNIGKFLTNQSVVASAALESGKTHWFFVAGRSRGGYALKGGLTWCDFIMEFMPIRGVDQIVGHREVHEPRWHTYPYSKNLDLDTKLQNFAIWDGDNLEIKPA